MTRNRKNLGLSQTIDIVEKVKFKWIPYKDVAKEHRVHPQAILDLLTKLRKDPKYIKELARHKHDRDKHRQTVSVELSKMMYKDLHISTVSWVKEYLKTFCGI
ncbi:MAG: hypothetical protein VX071_00625 [Candidatus Thermoplasmatota archaeon]|nr:hypothetical protein [Candidatus Thermoplasmatota archaeon]